MRHHRPTYIGSLFLTILLLSIVVACEREATVDEQLQGTWKNGDGNLLRFEGDGRALVGQEGLSGEGECRYELRGDSVSVTMIPDEDPELRIVYRLWLDGDTLRLLSFERHTPYGMGSLTAGEYAQQTGRPAYKLDFTRTATEE
ncbi:MAG: hypothetical protein KFH87_12935 [Bacteroidetes bacterium]|nr:hypothetical protein [Bacteroidota bacterium]